MKYCIHADCIIFRYDVAMFLFCNIFYKYYKTLLLTSFAAEQQDICRQYITKRSFSYIEPVPILHREAKY